MSQGNFDVRGHTHFNKPASPEFKFLARATDCFIILTVGSYLLQLTQTAPAPGLRLIGIFTLLGAGYWLLQKKFFGATLGDHVWRLKPQKNIRYQIREKLFQQSSPSVNGVFIGSLIVASSAIIAFTTLNQAIWKHPIWRSVTRWELPPIALPLPYSVSIPMFYTQGAWPLNFDGRPVFYTLEYKKGPPNHFVGHILANWVAPEISVDIEGPKTPRGLGNQEKIKDCFANRFSLSCLTVRDTFLKRHLQETHALSLDQWTLQWSHVNNPKFPPEEQSQGLYIKAENDFKIQDRFVLINTDGIQQTLILNRPKSLQGEIAFGQLLKTIQSLRIYNELNSGRAFINQEIEKIQFNPTQESPDLLVQLSRISEIQSYLISRISVLPQSYDSYFHLAGTSLLLMKATSNSAVPELSFMNSLAQKNIDSAYRYSQDVSPNNPENSEILTIWQSSQKH